jgi:AraC-like DNA-binding protein
VLESAAPTPDAEPERVLPDGCSEIIVHFGDPFRRLDEGGRAVSQKRALFAGQMERFVLLRPEGRVGMFGIRFEPGGVRPFVDVALHELTGKIVALQDVWHGAGPLFEERLQSATTDPERIAISEAFLASQMRGATVRMDVRRAVQRVVAAQGLLSVDEVAQGLFGGRRNLERAFREYVGLSPKRLARIVRFQTVFQFFESDVAEGAVNANWVRAAIDCGYYDQSHLNRDFRQFAGLPPTHYTAASHPIGDCFIVRS